MIPDSIMRCSASIADEYEPPTAADLAAWREALGWSQRRAASELGVRLNTYQQWERGERFGGGEVVIDRRTALACAELARQHLRAPV